MAFPITLENTFSKRSPFPFTVADCGTFKHTRKSLFIIKSSVSLNGVRGQESQD